MNPSPDSAQFDVAFVSPQGSLAPAPPHWKTILAEAIRDPHELCRLLELPPRVAEEALLGGREFPLLLPRTMLPRIRKGDPNDPVLRQFLPIGEEMKTAEGFTRDPLEEQAASVGPGILAKYSGRILIVTHPACPVHCRYCFRRYFPYAKVLRGGQPGENVENRTTTDNLFSRTLQSVLDYLSLHHDVREVILSGGEPLLLEDDTLACWLSALESIDHVRRLRLHSRMPIVIPQRVTPQLVRLLAQSGLTKIVVLHANHPREIDESVAQAIHQLRQTGAILLVQSVLLAGINDSPDVLAELYELLASHGVLPYYLHQLDRVQGTHHFEVIEDRGRQIVTALRRRLPGYLVPRYVRELPRADSKVTLV